MSAFANTRIRISDYLEFGVASSVTFLIGSIGIFVWGFFAYILFVVILVAGRIVTGRMVTCPLVIVYLSFYPVGVTAASAVLSWIEWADGRTDAAPLLLSAIAVALGLWWGWLRLKTK